MINIKSCNYQRALKSFFVFVPYLFLVLLGIYLRIRAGHSPFLYPDSNSYLLPAILRKISGQWFPGARPLQYPLFIYLTLSSGDYLKFTILIQQILGIIGCLFLIKAWFTYIENLNGGKTVLHAIGWLMTAIYATSPILIFYEKLVEPESIGIFLMCILIYESVKAYSAKTSPFSKLIRLSLMLFINSYLAAPMTKWVFAAIFLDFVFLYSIYKLPDINNKIKIYAVGIPIVLYSLFAIVPEMMIKNRSAMDDRYFIELNQMVYTHFPLLIRDKTNFPVSGALQDSLEIYYHQSQLLHSNTLLGFSNDELMCGKANEDLIRYFHYDFDTLKKVFVGLNLKLITAYPFDLGRDISRQFFYFYVPNSFVKKEIYAAFDPCPEAQNTVSVAETGDSWLRRFPAMLRDRRIDTAGVSNFLLAEKIQRSIPPRCLNNDCRPYPIDQLAFVKYFDWIFLISYLLFFVSLIIRRQQGSISIILFISALSIYVLTISIIHTFDVQRFVSTIFPFLIFPFFMIWAYLYSLCFSAFYTSKK